MSELLKALKNKSYSEIYKVCEEKRELLKKRNKTANTEEERKQLEKELDEFKAISKLAEEVRDLEIERLKGQKEPIVNKELRMINSNNIDSLYKDGQELSIGKYVRGAITGNWENAENEKSEYRSLSTSTGTVLIPKSLSAEILKVIMNNSVIYGHVPIIEMPNGNLTIAKITKNPEFAFKTELEKVNPVDATFGSIDLKSKTVYGLMNISIETLESAKNLDSVVKQAMADALSDAIDKSMLYGTGEKDIKGLLNYETINSIESSSAITNYNDFVNGIGKIRSKNGNPKQYVVNADIDTKLNLLADNTGQPLKAPDVILQMDRYVSNNLKLDAMKGSDAIMFDPNALLIGQQVQFKFEISRSSGFDDGSVWLRVYSMLDMAVLRPEHITKIVGLK